MQPMDVARSTEIESPHAVDPWDRVCVVIPMYRAEPYILSVLEGIPAWVWRIIAVDDCSPDHCAEKVMALRDSQRESRIIVASHQQNQGVGGAMLTGMNKAVEIGASVMVKMDSDGQMSSAYLEDLVAPIVCGRADYTKGNRFYHTRQIVRMPLIRRVGNLGLSFLTKMASGYWNVFDPTNGYVAISARTFQALDQQRIHRRYFFETSMLLELNLVRAVIMDVPMPAIYQGEISSLSAWKSFYEFFYFLFRGMARRFWLQYFVLDFSIASLYFLVGALLCLFGVGWGAYFWEKSIATNVIASTGTVMIAVLPLILGFQLLIQALAYDVQNVPRTVQPRPIRPVRSAVSKE